MIRLATAAAAAMVIAGAASAETPVERGSYLVNTIMTCGNCHSPKGPPAAVEGKDFSGGLRFDEPPFDVTAPNITPDPDTGIGKWSDADIKKALHDGIGPNGVPLAVVMPTGFYGILLPSDLDAIVAYLHTVKPVKNKVPDPIYKMAVPREIFPGAEKPINPADLNDKVKRGHYLATIGHCMECHTPMVKGDPTSRIRSVRAAANSPARGANRSRATSRRARPRASAIGPTPRSRRRSRRGSTRTARSSIRRWATAITRT